MTLDIHIGLSDLLIIYLTPIALVIFGSLFYLAALWLIVQLPFTTFDFKYDLLFIFESQKNLKRYRYSRFPFLTFFIKSFGDSGFQALYLYRVSRFFHNYHMGVARDLVHRISKLLTHVDISPYATIGRGLNIYHGLSIVIGKNTVFGERCLICQGVTTGSGAPQIGNNVKLWAGAKVMGNISIGDNSEVGANGVLLESLPANCIAVGVPATKIISKAIPA